MLGYEPIRAMSENLSEASVLGCFTYRLACERSISLSFTWPAVPGGN